MQPANTATMTKVMSTDSVAGSVVTLLQTYSARLRKAANDPKAVTDIADTLGRNANAWAAAVEANTPSATLIKAEAGTDPNPTIDPPALPAPAATATASNAGVRDQTTAAAPKARKAKGTPLANGVAAANAANLRTPKARPAKAG